MRRALRAPGVAGGDRLTLKLDAVPDANRLLIDAKLTAPAGGLVDSYAGLGKPLALSIDGRGDWANWAGRASGTVGGQAIADLALTGAQRHLRRQGQCDARRDPDRPGGAADRAGDRDRRDRHAGRAPRRYACCTRARPRWRWMRRA